MPIKTTYTEEELKQYMEDILAETADKINLSASSGSFDEAVLEVLYTLEIDNLSSINSRNEARKLRAVARVEALRTCANSTIHEASHSAGSPGTGVANRADIHRHCKRMFETEMTMLLDAYPELGATFTSRKPTKNKVIYDGDYYAGN